MIKLDQFRNSFGTAWSRLTERISSEAVASAATAQTGEAGSLPLADHGKAAPKALSRRAQPSLVSIAAIGIGLLLLGGVLGLYFQGPALRAIFNWTPLEVGAGARKPIALPVERIPSKERVAALAVGDVLALGRLRPQGGIVAVGLPAGTGDARIDKILVAQGDAVDDGALLAILDTRIQYEAALDNAETTLATRRASLDQMRAQIAVAEAETKALLESATVSQAVAESELARASQLQKRGAATEVQVEDAKAKADAAKADVARLTATLSRYTPNADGKQVDIALAEAELAAAEAALKRARKDLDRARVYAPRGGTIIELAVREGERPPQEGLLRLGNVARMEAELEVFQTMVSRVAIGQSVSIRSNALGETALTGRVARIGTLVGRQNVTADDPAANTDARVLEVIVAPRRSLDCAGRPFDRP
ncbi:MAG: HlyD family efflux transporter periplasmic adaptor subunit [Rhodomicrobium sp.]|nr:HlyD family efflux transporter periplasmic adaptor subunit [Rhodomicrobium sp.]